MSPTGESILTGAGDETLRFWNVFDSSQYKKHETLSFQMDLRWVYDILCVIFVQWWRIKDIISYRDLMDYKYHSPSAILE